MTRQCVVLGADLAGESTKKSPRIPTTLRTVSFIFTLFPSKIPVKPPRCRQVFWLPGRPTLCAFPPHLRQWPDADFVTGYSGGTAMVLHHLPYYVRSRTTSIYARVTWLPRG